MPGQEEDIKTLEMFRLKMLLRQLQISSFSGKMSALNEVNKVISGVIYTPQRHTVTVQNQAAAEDEDWLTADRMAAAANKKSAAEQLEQLFMTASDSLTLYQLECCVTLVMPAGSWRPGAHGGQGIQVPAAAGAAGGDPLPRRGEHPPGHHQARPEPAGPTRCPTSPSSRPF